MTDSTRPDTSITEREIRHQPEVWMEVAQVVRARRAEIDAFLRPLLARAGLRIVLTGAGTSAFIGEMLAPALSAQLHRTVEAIPTTDIVAAPRQMLASTAPTLMVSFARSGDSPESVAAVQLADTVLPDVHHLIVTCHADGHLSRHIEGRRDSLALVTPSRANDRAFAMTSSFTTMALMLLLAINGDDDELVQQLAEAAHWILADGLDLDPLLHPTHQRIVFLGTGALRGLARESALKVQEVTAGRIDTYWDSPLAFRHGPKAVLGPQTAVVAFRSSDPYTRSYDDDMIRELRAGGTTVLAIGGGLPADDDEAHLPVDHVPDDAYLALPLATVAQLLAIRIGGLLEIDVDDPFPGGEVNRVVQGVDIHPFLPAHH